MIFIVSAVVMMSATTPLLWTVRIIMTMIPLILLVIEKRYSSAACFTILYAFALVLTFRFMSEKNSGILQSLLTGYSGIVVQFLPALITAWYVVRTTKIGEFMSAMQKLHVPDGISISLAVVMRFFPTIKEEYSSKEEAERARNRVLHRANALISKLLRVEI